MKKLYVILFAALCCSLSCSYEAYGSTQGDAATFDSAALRSQLVAQVDVFMQAWEKQDAAALIATMAPEFLYVTSRGISPKQSVVGALTHACSLTSYSLSDVRLVPISSDSATLVYKLHQSASCMGHPDPPIVLNTDTLVRREGRWLFLVTTSTPAQ